MSKLLLHNISIPFKDTPSDIYSFDHAALFFSEAGDTIITRRLPDHNYLKFLSDLGVAPKSFNIVVTGESISPYVLREKPELVKKIRSNSRDHTHLDVFMPTLYEEWLAKELNLPYPHTPSQYERFVSKNEFRITAKKLGLLVPPGYEYALTRLQVLIAGAKLFFLGAREIVIKQDDGVSGSGLRRLNWRAFLRLALSINLFPVTRVEPLSGRGFVVEKWIDSVVYRPSVQVLINAAGEVEILSIHDQTMRSNRMTYSGCRSQHWLPKEVVNNMKAVGVRYARHLVQESFRGHFSIGAVVDATGNLYLNELNPRRVISSYPFQIVSRLVSEKDDTPPYVLFELSSQRYANSNIPNLLLELGSLLYDRKRGTGVIPFDLKFIKHGMVSFLIIGTTVAEVEDIYRRLIEWT